MPYAKLRVQKNSDENYSKICGAFFILAAIATRGQLCRDAETMGVVHNHCPPPIWADIWLFILLYFFKEEETFRIESTLGK